jgi:hypothetical protein
MEAAAASAVKSAATVATAMTATMAATVTTMATSDFGRQPVGSVFRRWRRGWIDRRKRFRALAGGGRQHQHRGSRKTQGTDKAAPAIWNLHHACNSPDEATKARAAKAACHRHIHLRSPAALN